MSGKQRHFRKTSRLCHRVFPFKGMMTMMMQRAEIQPRPPPPPFLKSSPRPSKRTSAGRRTSGVRRSRSSEEQAATRRRQSLKAETQQLFASLPSFLQTQSRSRNRRSRSRRPPSLCRASPPSPETPPASPCGTQDRTTWSTCGMEAPPLYPT